LGAWRVSTTGGHAGHRMSGGIGQHEPDIMAPVPDETVSFVITALDDG